MRTKFNPDVLLLFVLAVLLLAAYMTLVLLNRDASFIQMLLFGSVTALTALATGRKQEQKQDITIPGNNPDIDINK